MAQTVTATLDYWSQPEEGLLAALTSRREGLTSEEAAQRLKTAGPNAIKPREQVPPLIAFLNQFKSPLVLILIFAAILSALSQEWVDAIIVLIIVLVSAVLSFVQEYKAGNAVEKLRKHVTIKANVLRDGQPLSIPAEEVVPGDVVLLSAGALVPADGRLLEAKDLHLSQAALTGETFPVPKKPGVVGARASLAERSNCVFMGTNVPSGSGRVVIAQTGIATTYGQIAQHLTLRVPQTDFERGIAQFGAMLTQIMVSMVLVVFAINVILAKPAIDSLLFAVALAVGIAPELLPAIIGITLSRGAQRMASRGVIVRQLASIENLGSMDVLCTDKTGTLTEGVVRLDGALDPQGQASAAVLRSAYLNAFYQSGMSNPLDEAIVAQPKPDLAGVSKVDEVPYDFVRKRLSVVVQDGAERWLVSKGALEGILAASTRCDAQGGACALDDDLLQAVRACYTEWSEQGYRVLGVAAKRVEAQSDYTRADETELIFMGFLLFFDPPKASAQQALADLNRLGVQVKIITGDNALVAQHVSKQVGMPIIKVITGADLNAMSDTALWQSAQNANLFAAVDPNQKERIILALRKTGHVVGYMGDGINDAPALHTADVGISVDSAVDVAKEAAQFVLLKQDLDVLRQGIEEGRTTFANTLKYVFTTTSANFGNMFSMAGLSLFLPFLPLLAKQILLNNFLSDFPAMTIAGDAVDRELVERPRRWNIRFIRNFMVTFGLVSSVFDYLTFGMLLFVLRATEEQFRTGWFVESLLTELLILLVVRTRRPLLRSKPGTWLWLSTLLVALVTIALPYLPGAHLLGFVPLSPLTLGLLLAINALYVVANEVVKKAFFRRATA